MNHDAVAANLKNHLDRLGFTGIDMERLQVLVKKDANDFRFRHWQMHKDDKLKATFSFDRIGDNYALGQYELVNIPKLPVVHATVNGVDTDAFEKQLRQSDWDYTIAESNEVYLKGQKDAIELSDKFEQLARTPDGLIAATVLWHNEVPIRTIGKPGVISDFEDESGLYHKMAFDADTPVDYAWFKLSVLFPVGVIDLGMKTSPVIMDAGMSDMLVFDHAQFEELKRWTTENVDEINAQYVVVKDNRAIIHPGDIAFFQNDFDAQERAFELTSDRDFFESMTVGKFMRSIHAWEDSMDDLGKLLERTEGKMQQLNRYQYPPDTYEEFYLKEKYQDQAVYLLGLLERNGQHDKAAALWDKYVDPMMVTKPDFLTNERAVMTEIEFHGPYDQLSKANMRDAYNASLINDMKAGKPSIEQPFTRGKVDGEEVNFTLYWNKSSKTGDYHLNKWDIKASGPLVNGEASRTFYNNSLSRLNFTANDEQKMFVVMDLQQSANYLLGRAVYAKSHNLRNKVENNYEQLFYNEKGDSFPRKFRKEYPFDFDEMLRNYAASVVNFANTVDSKQFSIDLKRGNLVDAKFIANDGRKENLKVSLNIQVQCLNVYDNYATNPKPMSPELLVEKGYISPAFGKQIRERMDQVAANKIAHEQAKEVAKNAGQQASDVKESKQADKTVSQNKKDDKAVIKKNKSLKHK